MRKELIMVEIHRVLCPIDFSDHSRHALQHAIGVARLYRAQITVVHVYSAPLQVMPPTAFMAAPAGVPQRSASPAELRDVTEEVRRFCEPLVSGAPPEIVVVEGTPAKEIVRLAEQVRADLLVMGTHGRGGFERLVLGSVTEKVVRTSRSAVLTIPPAVQSPAARPVLYKTILCAVDFSDASNRAVEYAVSLAQENDARLILLHVVEGFVDEAVLDVNVHWNVPEYRRYLEQDALARLKAVVPAEARTSLQAEERLASGKPYKGILRIADDSGAELIVMGVQGHETLDRLAFGSTTHHMVREARCPVLTVRGLNGGT